MSDNHLELAMSKEVLDVLRVHFDIPDNVRALTVRLEVGQPAIFEVEYHPAKNTVEMTADDDVRD